ncbi:TPA: FumA C-terminus/TtdB family hydratase beta subunit [Escherichia coli]|nr:fumarate hydratase [Escherichia coli]
MSKPFIWQEPFLQNKDGTEYTLISDQHITVTELDGEEVIKIAPEALTLLARQAFYEASFFLRSAHLQQVASILNDPQASSNDKYVALQLLRNAEVSAKGVLPNCQDTGTATIVASKGQQIWTGGNDAEALSKGIYSTFQENNLRFSQNAPLDMYTEVNTQTNLPAQIDISAVAGNEYHFLCVNKGGGSANKAALYQETKSLLQPEKLTAFLIEKMKSLGTAACPPYHIAFVVGGLSADQTLKVAKLASTKYYDNLPTSGNEQGQAFRDIELEKLEHNPGQYIPASLREENHAQHVQLDLNRPLRDVMQDLARLPVGTRVSLSGPIVVARDIAHAKIKARLDSGEPMPDYLKHHIVYYAGPAKTPENMACGSLGPTTGGRMDGYVDTFQAAGGSLVMLSKGNRSQQVTDACHKHGGFNLGSIGGAAALLAQEYVKSLRCLEYPELGMEAVWMMEVENLPAFILVDDKGNNFFSQFEQQHRCASCPAGH